MFCYILIGFITVSIIIINYHYTVKVLFHAGGGGGENCALLPRNISIIIFNKFV